MLKLTPVAWIQIIFIFLKLTNTVDWVWGVVLFPFWVILFISIIETIQEEYVKYQFRKR